MFRRLTTFVSLSWLLAACAGGGSTVPRALPTALPASTAAPAQHITVTIAIPGPRAATATRGIFRPRYISINTQSASVAVNGGAPVVANLSPSSPNCAPQPGGGRSCSLTIAAPIGVDTFVENMYASTDGTGPALSTCTTSATIVAGQANVVKLTLDGIVAAIALALAIPDPVEGSPVQIPLAVNFLDASGAAIIGNDAFANPITLTDSDQSGATSLSITQIDSPNQAANVIVNYNGAVIPPATFNASAAGVPSGNITPAILTPQPVVNSSLVDWITYGYDNARSGFNPYSTAITPSTIPLLHLAWQKTSNGQSLTQPIVATNIGGHQGIVIVGNFNGLLALDALTGAQVWSTYLGTQNLNACGTTASVAGTPVFYRAEGSVYMAAGDSGSPSHVLLYRLDVASGSITGKVDLTPQLLNGEAVFGHAAVTLADGTLYVGTGSNCEGATTGPPSWRGRVVAVDPSSLNIISTFFPTYGQSGGNVGGGGVWAWGGVSADPSGNIYVATGNAETPDTVSQTPPPPFVLTTDEQSGYAEHLVKLNSNLSSVEDSNYPGFNFQIGYADLDYAGAPVIYAPPLKNGCGLLSATQGKGGTLVINNTANLNPPLYQYALSTPNSIANYIGNPAYSPTTGYLYAAITSAGLGSSMLPPGLAAIDGCGSGILWNAQFGPDSGSYPTGPAPRSAPTVTAGGVVFIGTPCTSDHNGGCTTPAEPPNGAVWAVDATAGTVLGGGKPILVTPDQVLMAPTADGEFLYVLDNSGNLYALTIDQSIQAVPAKAGRRLAPRFVIRSR